MANEFKIKNGLIVSEGGAQVTGSLNAPNITGSLLGTSSWAVTSSHSITASYVTGSIFNSTNPVSSASYALSASFTITASFSQTASYVNPLNQTVIISGSLLTTGSNIFIGNQTVTGSLFTSGSNTLVGVTTLTGSLNISGSTTQVGSNSLLGNTTLSGSIIISGALGTNNPTVRIYGDTEHNGYIRFDPVTTNINSSISASYIYVSGSTNDLYFTQNGAGYGNTTRLRWLEGNLYTGLLNGGIISATLGTNTYTVGSGSGVIVNLNATAKDNPYPTIQYLNWGNLTGTIDALSASYDQSFVAVLSNSTIGAQGTPYNDGDYNTKIPIGIVLHQNHSSINAYQTFPSVGYGWKQRSFDFIKAFGPLKISGYTLAPSGSSTGSLVLGGGTAWVDGRNYTVDPNTPSYIQESSGIVTSKIYRYRQSGSSWVYDTNGGAGYTTIDPANYSNNGVLTPVATNDWSIQRVFYFPNSATKAFYIYYGNATYSSQANALAAVATETFGEAPNTAANAIYVGYMILRHNADFTVAASYTIYQASLFRNAGSATGTGGGGGGGATALTGLTDVSLTSPTDYQPFAYNSVTSKWENRSTISASLAGNANTATTASYAFTSSFSITASYALNATIFPYTGSARITGSLGVTGSFSVSGSGYNVLGDTQFTGSITSLNGYTGSLFGTSSWSINSVSASYALSASRIIDGNITATVSSADPTQLFIIKSGTVPYLNISSSGNADVYSNLFVIRNFTTKQPVLTVTESIVQIATQSVAPTGVAPNGGIWFTSASMYIGID